MKIHPTLNKKGEPRVRFEMSVDEMHALDNDYSGLCIKCGAERCGDTEPDARKYPCESCGENFAYGAQELLIMGYITIAEKEIVC